MVTFQALRGDYGRNNGRTVQGIGNNIKKFEEIDVVSPMHHRILHTAENVA